MTIALIWMVGVVNAGNAPNSPHIRKSGKAFFLFAFTIALSFLIGRGSAQSILVTVRNLTVFYMAYEIGYKHLSGREFKKFQSFYFLLAVVMLIAGIILLIGGFPFYQSIGIIEVYIAKGQSTISHTSLDGRFFSDVFNIPVSRMGSLYYEPVNLAYFFAIAFLIAWFAKGAEHTVNHLLRVLISGTGLFLTFGKGGWLLVIATFLCVYGYRFLLSIFTGMSKRRAARLILGVEIAAVAIFSVYYYKRVGGAVGNHFYGIAQGWKNALQRPFGYGLGTGGNMAAVFGTSTNQGWLGSGGESALITYLFQLGFQGVLALTLCMKRLSAPFHKRYDPKWLHPFHFLPLILLFVSIFQENTFTPQCIVPFMFLQGGAVRNWESELKDKEIYTLYAISCAKALKLYGGL